MKRVRSRLLPFCVVGALIVPVSAQAEYLFTTKLEVGGETETLGTNKARKVPDLFDNASLSDLFPGYTPDVSAVGAKLDIRGLLARVHFEAGSTTLRFRVPAAGIDLSFLGTSRDDVQERFEEWLKGESTAATTVAEFLQALVEFSPVDPVAGNPNSLQSRMFAADFRMGTSGPLIHDAGGEKIPNLFSVGLGAGSYEGGPWDVYTLDLPINYALNWEKFSMIFDLPLTATRTGGSWTGMGSGSLALQWRPTSWWALTPAVRFGGVGSVDVGGLAILYSGTITSQLRFPVGSIVLGISNMGGISKSWDGLELQGVHFEYDLANWITRNGGYLEGTFGPEFLGGPLGWRVFGSDVRFFGNDLYMNSYAEVGGTLASMRNAAGALFDGLSLSVSYLWGKDYNGVSLFFGFRF